MNTPLLDINEKNMAYFESKFERSDEGIKERYAKDISNLSKMGVKVEQIADKIESLILRAEQLYAEDTTQNISYFSHKGVVIIDGKFKVSGFDTRLMGVETCPFSLERICGQGRTQYFIKNIHTKQKAIFSELQLHLCREHGFFGKKRSFLRTNPVQLAKLLEIEPGKDYSPEISVQKVWSECRHKSPCPRMHINQLMQDSLEVFPLDYNVNAFLMHTDKIEPDPAQSDHSSDYIFEFEEDENQAKIEENDSSIYLHLLVDQEANQIPPLDIKGARFELKGFPSSESITVYEVKSKKVVKTHTDDRIVWKEIKG